MTLLQAPDTTLAWSRLLVTGDDALTYLQGQLSQDLTDFSSDQWSLVLAPDSVVVAVALVSRDDQGVALTLESAVADETLSRLRRFLLRARCSLEVVDANEGPFRTLEDRVRAEWPGPQELRFGLTPHVFGRRFVDATVSFTKGCFTGQELVGRLDARGAPTPWRFVYVEAPSLERADEVLRAAGPEGPQGLTSVYGTPEGVVGLGFAHRTLFARLASSPDILVREVQ